MKVQHYGNACFSLFHKGIHILCDPWLEAPAVAGGWEKFPPSKTRTKDLPKVDYIYVSHIHSDHCEPRTLAAFDKSIPIIGIDRKPSFLERMFKDAGFKNLILVPEDKRVAITPDLMVETFGVSVQHICAEIIDSSILFDFGDQITLNCNDNAPGERFCEELVKRYPKIDLAFLPCAGGSGYPAMYSNLSDSMKTDIVREAIERFSASFTRAVDILKPKIVVPVAGGYMIRGPLAKDVNRFQVRRTNLLEVVKYHEAHGLAKVSIVPLQPEMVLDADQNRIIQGQYHVWSEAELAAHLEMLSKEPVPKSITTTRPVGSLPRLVEAARRNLWEKQKSNKIAPAYRIYLDIGSQQSLFEIDLSREDVRSLGRLEALVEPYLKMSVDQDTMLEWLLGMEDFNMLDSGHRIDFFRAPNTYVVEAYYLMSLFRL